MALKKRLTSDEKTSMRTDLIESLRLSHLLATNSLGGLAAEYRVSTVTIWRVEKGQLDRAATSVLTTAQIEAIKKARKIYRVTSEAMEGYRMKAIADRYGTTLQTVYRYVWRLKDELGRGQPVSSLWEAA